MEQDRPLYFRPVVCSFFLLFGSRPTDHYFRSVCWFVCLSVCLFVCAEFFSAVFDPISIKLGHILYVWVQLCPLEYGGCATPGGWVTPKNLYFQGFWGGRKPRSVAASCNNFPNMFYCVCSADIKLNPAVVIRSMFSTNLQRHCVTRDVEIHITNYQITKEVCHFSHDKRCYCQGRSKGQRVYRYITVSTVVLNCCKGDRPSQWETPIFGPLQLENPLIDFDEICYQ